MIRALSAVIIFALQANISSAQSISEVNSEIFYNENKIEFKGNIITIEDSSKSSRDYPLVPTKLDIALEAFEAFDRELWSYPLNEFRLYVVEFSDKIDRILLDPNSSDEDKIFANIAGARMFEVLEYRTINRK